MNLSDFGVELTAEQREQVREVAERKATAARDLKQAIAVRFADNKRIGFETLMGFLDEMAEDMDQAAKDASV